MKNIFKNPVSIFSLVFTSKKKMSIRSEIKVDQPNLAEKEIMHHKEVILTEIPMAVSEEPIYTEEHQLIRQATELKGKDINKAIELVEKAIVISPEKDNFLRLANYLHMAGKVAEAYAIYEKLLLEVNYNDIETFNKNKAEILEKICSLDYKSHQHEKYITSYSVWLKNIVLAYACQGNNKELKKVIADKNKLKFLSPSKLNGCFKKLGKEHEKDEYNNKLITFIETTKEDLLLMTERTNKLIKNSKNAQERIDKWRADEEFIEIYKKLNALQIL